MPVGHMTLDLRSQRRSARTIPNRKGAARLMAAKFTAAGTEPGEVTKAMLKSLAAIGYSRRCGSGPEARARSISSRW